MDILTLKRDLPAIEDGRWVGGDEVKGLGDARLRVRGFSAKVVSEAHAARERTLPAADLADGRPTREARDRLARQSLQDALVDVEGFTANGEPVTLSQLREWIADPAFSPLADLVAAASLTVDADRVARAKALRGN